MLKLFPLLLATALLVQADEQTQQLVERLSQEAAALARLAPEIIGREKLEQRALKSPPRIRIRIGASATQKNEPEWQQRTLLSDYGYTVFSGGGIHELHQVFSADGKPVKNSGTEALMRIILSEGDKRKQELLKQFAGHGLRGAATDFGLLILLFAPQGILRYEFSLLRTDRMDGQPARVFRYRQIDGGNALTVVEEGGAQAALRAEGEIWARSVDSLPLRITLRSRAGTLEDEVRQEAAVDYVMSEIGALLPTAILHQEYQGSQLVVENRFTYSDFRRFGASAEITFDEPETPPAEGPAGKPTEKR